MHSSCDSKMRCRKPWSIKRMTQSSRWSISHSKNPRPIESNCTKAPRRATRSSGVHAEEEMTWIDRVQVHLIGLHQDSVRGGHTNWRLNAGFAERLQRRFEARELPGEIRV